jgi:hypothetical protein
LAGDGNYISGFEGSLAVPVRPSCDRNEFFVVSEVLHYSEIWYNIGRSTLKQNFDVAVVRATQHLLYDRGNPRKNLIDLAGRRTFRMQTDF